MVKWKCSCGKICIDKRPLYRHIDKSHRTEVLNDLLRDIKANQYRYCNNKLSLNHQHVGMPEDTI